MNVQVKNGLLYALKRVTDRTSIGSVVDHDTVARLQMLLHGNNTHNTHQVSHELLLVLTHLHQIAADVPYITQLGEAIANLGDNDDMNRSARINILEGTALRIRLGTHTYHIVLVHHIRRNGVVRNLLKKS